MAERDRDNPITVWRFYRKVVGRGISDWWKWIKDNAVWDALLLAFLALSGFVLHRSDSGLDAVLTPLIVLGALCAAAMLVSIVTAPVRLHRELQDQMDEFAGALIRLDEGLPRLSFGDPQVMQSEQPLVAPGTPEDAMSAFLPVGRIIRVRVLNARGAGDARHVHARLRFDVAGGDADSWVPDEQEGEWVGEAGDWVAEVDLPGNGRPRLLDIAAVMSDGPGPQQKRAYAWNRHSAPALYDYSIKAWPFHVHIEVEGAGKGDAAPVLRGVLEVSNRQGLTARWIDRG